MSFSRLSPRSARKGIVNGQNTKQRFEQSSRHLRLWEAIRRTREEIDSWQRQVDQVDAFFHRFIVPREEQLTNEYCDVTDRLISHFEEADLSAGDQSLLGLWITENLQSLSDHPFAPIHRRQALNGAWRILISVDGAIENQLARLARGNNVATSPHEQRIRDADTSAVPSEDQKPTRHDTCNRQSSDQQGETDSYQIYSSGKVGF
jgi:hypothetical protein